ncbi:MAG TPA: hypothetical protein VF932_15700 [Anaerolineae bacterium]
MIEMAGIPTMIVTRQGFKDVVAGSVAGFGFAPEAPTVYEFPVQMFLQSSDLTPINENIDKIVYGLTKWQPKVTKKGIFYPAEKIKVQGKDYQDALDKFNQLFAKNSWSDGMPLVPPTQERVSWILAGTDLPKDTAVGTGKILPRGGIASVESLAVAMAMAGGRPEYMPVLVAAIDAMTKKEFGLDQFNATTANPFPAVIVNGPVAKQIRLSSGYGLLGPDSVRPAGAVIGRALHLAMLNLGGAAPGTGSMAIYGQMRATYAVFAEDEAGLPKGWSSLAEDRGFKKGQNIVTVSPVSNATNVNLTSTDATEADAAAKQYLYRLAGTMKAPGGQLFRPSFKNPDMATGVVMLGRTWASALNDLGYDKLKLKTALWEGSKLTWDELVKMGNSARAKSNAGIKEGESAPMWAKPEQLLLVVAGGDQSGHAFWMGPGGTSGYTTTNSEIQLPKNWDQLIKQAEADLGPAPAN